MSMFNLSHNFGSMSLQETPQDEEYYEYPGEPLNWNLWRINYGETWYWKTMGVLCRLMTLWHRLCYSTCHDTLQNRAEGLDEVGPLGYIFLILAEIEMTLSNSDDLIIEHLSLPEVISRVEQLEEEYLQLLTMNLDPTLPPDIDDPYFSALVFNDELQMERGSEDLPHDEPGLFLFLTYVCCRLGYVMPLSDAPGHEARLLSQLSTCAKTSWNIETLKAMWSY